MMNPSLLFHASKESLNLKRVRYGMAIAASSITINQQELRLWNIVVHGGLLVARGKGKVWDNSLYSITGLLLTTVWLPLCCPSAFFQAA
jgi:hypothetical protein